MLKCPRCMKEISELDEKCKYCGLDFSKYEEKIQKQEISEDEKQGYVTGYNILLVILAVFLFIGGLVIGQEDTNIMLMSWGAGIVLLAIMNMLKNIIEELRKLNEKTK